MYKAFFNLQSQPFEIAPDAGFLWLGEKHKEALAALRYGIRENKGFVLLTGGAGAGKTTLINALLAGLDDSIIYAVISNPTQERLEFYNAIATGFGLAGEFTSKVQFLIQFSHFLHQAAGDEKKVLLIIDDCQRLSQEMLEELRLLSNIENDDAKLINIFFVGQRDFNDTLIQPNNRAIRQRLTIKVDLPALSLTESEEYIHHRLKIAGTAEKLFSAKATQIIHQHAMGVPKRINIICDQVMAAGCVQGKHHLDHHLVGVCLQKLNLSQKPTAEDYAEMAGGKNHLEDVPGHFTPGDSGHPSAVSAIHRHKSGTSSVIKYGAVSLGLVGAVLVFWYFGKRVEPVVVNEPVKVQEVVPLKETMVVHTSPAVAVMEPNRVEINDKKAAELKTAILKKAYKNGDGAEETPTGSGSATADRDNGKQTAASLQPVTPDKGVATMAKSSADKVGDATSSGAQKALPTTPQSSSVPPLPEKVLLPLAANSLKLTSEGNSELQAFLAKVKDSPHTSLLVKGFVSSSTASAENTRLSEERAMAVQKLLVAGGIEAERITVKGMGIEEPIAPNNTGAGRTKNRRVEILILHEGQK
jgi:general secretion pathway protein A